MKFRAIMTDSDHMREFANIATAISKLSKECVLRLAENQLYFIVSEENGGPAPSILWCEIPQVSFFSEYQMIGLDEDHKDIYLGLTSGNLARSLAPLKIAKSVKIKLTKKQCPCLTLDIKMPSSTQHDTRQVIYDIPAIVIPRKMWSNFQEPSIPHPDISIELPPLKQLRTTIDRMRTMAPEVVLRASAEGRFSLQIKTDTAKVTTRFKNLTVHNFEGPIEHSDSEEIDTQINEDILKVCLCRVNTKKLSMFLSTDQVKHNQAMCSIVHRKLVILCLQTEDDVKLQCFISGIVY